MIEKLTPQQIARFQEFRDKWMDVGLSTEKANRKEAVEGIYLAYEKAGLKAPKVVWCSSPMVQGLTRSIILDKEWASVGASVGDSVGASVWASVGDSVRDSVWASVRDSVYGQHDAGWLSFYSFFRDVFRLKKQTEKLNGLFELAQSCGWILPHKNICFASERHNILNRDEQGRLHNPSGPALMYPDGFGVWAIHGVRLPEYIIERPQEITCDKIESQQNSEIRRVMIEKYGTSRYLIDSGAKEIHRTGDNVLYRKQISNDEALQMVRVLNSTPELTGERKEYFLRVPPGITTANNAVAWTFDMSPKEYADMVES